MTTSCSSKTVNEETINNDLSLFYESSNMEIKKIHDIVQTKENESVNVQAICDLSNEYLNESDTVNLVYSLNDKEWSNISIDVKDIERNFKEFDSNSVANDFINLYDSDMSFEISEAYFDPNYPCVTAKGYAYSCNQAFYAKRSFGFNSIFDYEYNDFIFDRNNMILNDDTTYEIADISCHYETTKDENPFLNRDLSIDIIKDGTSYTLNNMYIYDSILHGENFNPITLDFKYEYIVDSDEAVKGILNSLNPDVSPYTKPGLVAVLTFKPDYNYFSDSMVFYIIDDSLYFISGMGYEYKNPEYNAYSFFKSASHLIKSGLYIEPPIYN